MKNKVVFWLIFIISLLFEANVFAQRQFVDIDLPDNAPFDAWITTDIVYLKPDFEHVYAGSVAILEYGDIVHVLECRPNCIDPHAWVSVEAFGRPFGVMRLSNLSPLPRTQAGEFLSSGTPNFTWARVRVNDTVSRVNPDNSSEIVERFHRGDELAFRTNPELMSQGYLERPRGGFVPVSSLYVFTPSSFSGWINPPDNFMFVNRDMLLTKHDGTVQPLTRYQRFEILSENRTSVTISQGTVPRNMIRVGHKHNRPSGVPSGVRWVHVDLDQQILTAYDRNDDLVFGTLVSTGRRRGSTPRGIWQVRRKITYTQMVGGSAGHRYSVEGVPYVMYLDFGQGAVALHGSFWHNSYGNVYSHGCINLSLADARYMYNFHPVELPRNWHSISILNARLETLWVVVE